MSPLISVIFARGVFGVSTLLGNLFRHSKRLIVAAAKIAAMIGMAMLLTEALFRVNLSKHLWLITSQAGITAVMISCLVIRAFFYRDGISTVVREPTRSTIVSEQASDQRAGRAFARRGVDYFGMSGAPEFILATALFAFLILLTVLNLLHRKFDSDEPQHLHVVWSWARGFVQYRDLFDNHMPLFHLTLAPIAAVIGERATLLHWMRCILLPIYFVAAWGTYRIGTSLFSRRAGVWAVLGVGFFSGYFPNAIDFRPNNLWLPIWLLCIAVLVSGAISVRRALAAGLLLGLCFGLSMKSTVFLLSLAFSAPVSLVLVGRKNLAASRAYLIQCAAAFLGTTVLVPGVIMIFFALKGVWPDFRYGVFDFNFLADRFYQAHLVYKSHPALAVTMLATTLPVVIYVARWISRASSDPGSAFCRVLILLVCA